MPGIALYGLVGVDRDATWSPALGLGVTHVSRSEFAEAGGSAAFALDAAYLDLCAFRFGRFAVDGRVCGSALAGRLSAEGSDTLNPTGTLRRPFATLGGAVLLAFRLDETLELTARTAAGRTLVQDSFEFGSVVFHTAAPLTVGASVGIGFRSR
jgi:hypothetical protein